jgi:hypothetical protein
MTDTRHEAVRSESLSRWWVHLGLIVTVTTSLWFEPMLTIHIVVGLAFIGFCAVHLGQRRRISLNLLARLKHPPTLHRAQGRLALADAFLAALTLVMLFTGLWDWLSGEPTRTRWHAISGVILTGFLVVHTVRRRARLRRSRVR